MTTKLLGILKKVAGLVLIELMVPGGTLLVLTLLFMGCTLPIPERLAAVLPVLKVVRRS